MRIWDTFPYWRERWAVDARLKLWEAFQPGTDYHPVALVGDRTHRGNPLPPDLPPPGIETVHVILDAGSDWGREHQQRDAVSHLRERMDPDDLVLVCDADELVDPRRLDAILDRTQHSVTKLAMTLFFYGTNWRFRDDTWRHASACRARQLPETVTSTIRLVDMSDPVPDAGWHISYVGDIDQKIKAFAHSEIDTPEFRSSLARAKKHGYGPGVNGPKLGLSPLHRSIATLINV